MRYRSTSLGIFFAILASSTWAGLIHPAAAQDAPVTMTLICTAESSDEVWCASCPGILPSWS